MGLHDAGLQIRNPKCAASNFANLESGQTVKAMKAKITYFNFRVSAKKSYNN